VSVASLFTAFRPFGAPSPLFVPPLGFRLHPALKQGRSSSLRRSSIRGGVACYGLVREEVKGGRIELFWRKQAGFIVYLFGEVPKVAKNYS